MIILSQSLPRTVTVADSDGHSRTFEFHTGSADTASSSTRTLNSETRFVQSFTSSWIDNFTFTSEDSNYVFVPTVSLGTNNTAVFIGDGNGMLYCYNLTTGNLEYGIQASSSGAVRAITMVDNILKNI